MNVKNKKVIYTIIGIAAVILVTIGITYAYWLITKNQTGSNIISSACLDISLTNEENDITLTNQFPLSDADGMKLTPYTFTVTNNCNTSVDYQIALETFDATDTISPSAIKVMIDSDTPVLLSSSKKLETRLANATKAYLLKYGTLSAKDTEGSSSSHSLRIWIDENAPISEMKKTLTSKISVTIGQGIEAPQGSTLSSLILEDAETNNYLYTTTPDFSIVTEDGEYGLYTAADDYGLSYYFRGDVENNYVELGDYMEQDAGYIIPAALMIYDTLEECESSYYVQDYNETCYKTGGDLGDKMYWRIVRINGDGTVRLIYDGTNKTENKTADDAIIKFSTSDFSLEPKYINQPSRERLDLWYAKHLNNSYSQYISDTIFCNDNSLRYIYYDDNFEETLDVNSPYIREVYGAQNRLNNTPNPILTCPQDEDKYTVNIDNGNELLDYPIGFLTADEAVYAGSGYLYSNTTALTMTPYGQDGPKHYAYTYTYVYNKSLIKMEDGFNPFNDLIGVRPVINIKADVEFIGSGTIDDPYVLAS